MQSAPRTWSVRKLFSFFKKLRFYEVLLIILVVMILAVWGVKETTESAIFCGNSCHVMRPYYDEWKTSSHDEVSCVQCHIPPFEEPRFLPDFRAFGQVVSYLTRTYGRYTRAEVEDTNCLSENCHSHRLLEGRVTYAADITFDHTPHLQYLRRGKILRCTTCHARIVMGQHVAVAHDACFICHFKETGARTFTAECSLCHGLEQLAASDAAGGFDHSPFVQRGVPCRSCHEGIVSGNGKMDPEACRRCHVKQGEASPAQPVEELHRTHVTDHKVECAFCHEPIRHENPDQAQPGPKDCVSCHVGRHSSIESMYRGTGAAGVATIPSPMYMANVDCNGCHTVAEPTSPDEIQFKGETLVAVVKACNLCHGSDLSRQVEMWTKEIDSELSRAEKTLKHAEDIISNRQRDGTFPDVGPVMERARHNILFVRFSSPVHNRDYALRILEKTVSDLNGLLAADM